MYLLAILFPPLAVLFTGKPFQAIINILLTLFFYVPGVIHALLVVKEKKDNEQLLKQVEMMKNRFDQ